MKKNRIIASLTPFISGLPKPAVGLVWCFAMLLSLSALIVFTSDAQASKNQIQSNSNTDLSKGIEKNKPSIYLSYEGVGSVDENCSLKKQSTYRLKLHNNSPFRINIGANYDMNSPSLAFKFSDGTKGLSLPDGSAVSDVCYQAEPILKMGSSYENGKYVIDIPLERSIPIVPTTCRCVWSQQQTRRYDTFPGIWIFPGSSVVFNVPQQFLEKDLKIYTIFNFEWEFNTDSVLKYNEPHHQVYFYSSDIPKK